MGGPCQRCIDVAMCFVSVLVWFFSLISLSERERERDRDRDRDRERQRETERERVGKRRAVCGDF